MADFWTKVLGSARDTDLKDLIERWSHKDVSPPISKREGFWFRASTFASVCPREELLCDLYDVTRTEHLDADLLLIFLHGKALHWALQNELLPEIGVLRGKWLCLRCGEIYGSEENPVRRPGACEKCKKSEFLYREFNFRSEQYGIGGHTDGLLLFECGSELELFEAKSISPRGFFEVRESPQVQHVVQMQIYFWLSGLKRGHILYWNKGGNGTDAIRSFVVERDEETIQTVKDLIAEIRLKIGTGELMDRICLNPNAPRAKKCSMTTPCFEWGVRVSLPISDEEKKRWQRRYS
jgi:hypothetical protein